MNKKIEKSLNLMTKANHLFFRVRLLNRKPEIIDNPMDSGTRDRVFPIEAGLKNSLEYAFEADLSNVRIHMGEEADRLTSQHNAKAITIGRDIYFGGGKYEPFSLEGQQLLVHELQHVLQSKSSQPMVYRDDIAGLEADAERIEDLLSGRSVENLDKGELNNQSRYQRTNTSAGGNESLLRKAVGGETAGTLEDMLEADRRRHIEYRLGSGEVVILTEAEYGKVIELSKEAFVESLAEKQYSMTREQYEKEVIKTLSYLKGAL